MVVAERSGRRRIARGIGDGDEARAARHLLRNAVVVDVKDSGEREAPGVLRVHSPGVGGRRDAGVERVPRKCGPGWGLGEFCCRDRQDRARVEKADTEIVRFPDLVLNADGDTEGAVEQARWRRQTEVLWVSRGESPNGRGRF